MALLFCDSFDHYLTADINEKWGTASSAAISAGNGRRSTAGGWINSTQYFGRSLANQATIICGAAYEVTGVPTSIARIFSLWDSATQQVGLYLNQDLTLEVLRAGSTAVTNGKSTLTLAVDRWYFIEWKITIADSIGASSCVVKVDGQTWITVATGQDLKNTSNAYATEIRLGGSSASPVSYWDDFYLCDSSGSTNNDFLGDIRVDVLAPNGEGSNSGWTCSTGSTHYALVDETTPNDDTDYLSTSSAAARDSHNMASLPSMTSPTIKAVQHSISAKKDDGGTRQIKSLCKSGATTTTGAAQTLSSSYAYYKEIYETDPNTAAAWTETNLNSAEFGVENV